MEANLVDFDLMGWILAQIYIQIFIQNIDMSKHNKKSAHQKDVFSDQQVHEEIKDEIREIRAKKLKDLEEAEMIAKLYNRHKEDKRKRKMMK